MTWADVNQYYQAIAPNFLRLVDLLLTIPATSAEAERGFSSMKLVKNKLRSRLQDSNLNNILRIVLLSPSEEEFDPAPAVDHWLQSCARRNQTQTILSTSTSHKTESDEDDDSDVEPLEMEVLLNDAASL